MNRFLQMTLQHTRVKRILTGNYGRLVHNVVEKRYQNRTSGALYVTSGTHTTPFTSHQNLIHIQVRLLEILEMGHSSRSRVFEWFARFKLG